MRLFTQINGGATVLPAAEGGWLNEQGTIIWEHPVVVYTYLRPHEFVQAIPEVRELLNRMGRETSQGEIGFEFDGKFYRIRQFDKPRKGAKR